MGQNISVTRTHVDMLLEELAESRPIVDRLGDYLQLLCDLYAKGGTGNGVGITDRGQVFRNRMPVVMADGEHPEYAAHINSHGEVVFDYFAGADLCPTCDICSYCAIAGQCPDKVANRKHCTMFRYQPAWMRSQAELPGE